ncbi:MAG TPA: hypothetical protein VH598_01370, partial [Verrucomicrobiae bacterium]|nr:hypothetical protein [Verrucomicrobiae bacterium]
MKLPNLLCPLFFTFCLNTLAALPPDYEPVKAQAEKLYADGSFRLAHDEYEKAKAMELPAAE